MAEPDVSDLHGHRRSAQQDNLVAPIELNRLRPERSSAVQMLRRLLARVPEPSAEHSGARRRSRRHIRARAAPRTAGSASDVRVMTWSRSAPAADQARLANAQSSAVADLPAGNETRSPPDRITFLTTLRDTPNSRQIALIGLPCLKNARRIFAIVSTTSIPTSTSKNHGSRYGPSVPGSRLDADHPEMECVRDGGQFAGWALTGAAGLSEDESHGQAPH